VAVRALLPLAWQPPLIGLGMFGTALVLLDPRGSDAAVPAEDLPLGRRIVLALCPGLAVGVAYGLWLFH
jgi:hypothetical protein